MVQRNSRGVELQCTSLGWAHLPLKPVPNITALPLFLGSPRRIYTLNPLGLGEPRRRAPSRVTCSPLVQVTCTTPCTRWALSPPPPPRCLPPPQTLATRRCRSSSPSSSSSAPRTAPT
jgi:hypothetical protein